jgi:Protein of unknown function (DUF3124)
MKNRLLALCALAFFSATPARASEDVSVGQSLYLPVYSHLWHGDRVGSNKAPSKSLLSVLVSIRNTSLKTPVKIFSARYYSTEGKLLKEYVPKPLLLNAMGTFEIFVERRESEGGSGANFVIQWDSTTATNPPVVEALHADIKSGNHALAFITTASPIQADK